MRRYPPPWNIEALDCGFKIVDSNGQALAYVYGHADTRELANALTLDEARRIAKLPNLLRQGELKPAMSPSACLGTQGKEHRLRP